MNEELLRHLEDMGLSEKEAKVYVASLMLGPATVQQISTQADIKRVTTYVILESLAGLGLVSQTSHGKKTYFTAEDPSSLKRLLDKKQEELAAQRKNFETLLPELGSLKNIPAESPTVKFYDGAEPIRTIMATFLDQHKDETDKTTYAFSNLDQLHIFFPEFREKMTNPERVKAGFDSRFIYTTTRGPILADSDSRSNRVSRYVDPKDYPLNGDITIVGNHVLILSLSASRPVAVSLDSKEIADGFRAIFELAWTTASNQ